MLSDSSYARPLKIFFGIIAVLLVVHALFPPEPKKFDPSAMADGQCEGEALMVPYEYNGNVVDPWSCKIQCDDQKQRYLVYMNNVGTQCEPLPGCNDQGEDRGVTCRLPSGVSYTGPGASGALISK
jgi:hypothetical protein